MIKMDIRKEKVLVLVKNHFKAMTFFINVQYARGFLFTNIQGQNCIQFFLLAFTEARSNYFAKLV